VKSEDIIIIVVDELHLLADPSRGYLIELLLTKAIHYKIQVIAMSATIPNLLQLAEWLHA
jgi:DNA polymerase theta